MEKIGIIGAMGSEVTLLQKRMADVKETAYAGRVFYEGTLGRKGYVRLYLRAELEEGAWVRVACSEDGGPFRPVWASHDSRAGTAVIPLLPGRCDRFQIRISGRGGCLPRSLEREFSVGSER